MDRLTWRWWVTIVSAAVGVRAFAAFVLLGAMPMVSDAREYFELGARFARGDLGGAFYWPPGESVVLAVGFAAFGSSLVVARVLTIATSVGAVAFSALLARELAGDRAGRAAGWMAALYAPSVLLCGQTYAQHLAALCLAALAYFGLRAAREGRPVLFALAGVALVPMLVIAWGGAALRERSARSSVVAGAVLAAGVTLACVAPAFLHDERAGSGWTVSTNNERNLFLGNNPHTPDYKTSHLGQRSLDELDAQTREYLSAFYAREDSRAAMEHEALTYMLLHPFRTALRTFNRATSFWGFDYLASREIQRWHGWGARATLPLLALEGGSYLAVATLALVSLFAHRGIGDPGGRNWLLALALVYELPYALAFSGGTYHFPVMPLVVPIAAVALARPLEAWRRVRRGRATWAALAAFAALQGQYAYYAVKMQ
jgi:hypothetical protein